MQDELLDTAEFEGGKICTYSDDPSYAHVSREYDRNVINDWNFKVSKSANFEFSIGLRVCEWVEPFNDSEMSDVSEEGSDVEGHYEFKAAWLFNFSTLEKTIRGWDEDEQESVEEEVMTYKVPKDAKVNIGDTITLRMMGSVMSFLVNGKDMGEVFDDMNMVRSSLFPVVILHDEGEEIELLDGSTTEHDIGAWMNSRK